MASETEVCNMALSHIRAQSINNIEQLIIPAQQCKLWFNICRDSMLESTHFNFSHRVRTLARLGTVLDGWPFVYQYPSDVLHINKILHRVEDANLYAPSVEWDVFNVNGVSIIASHTEFARIDCRVKVSDLNMFDSNALIALSYLLAASIGNAIVGGEEAVKLKSANLTMYTTHLNASAGLNKAQSYSPTKESDFVSIRA